MTPLDPAVLPSGIRARFVRDINGLDVHMLEAGFDRPGRPLVVLLHGFPEIAYSWRKVMPALADAGFHVVAPDLRGYGRTTGWSANYDDDLRPFRLLNCVRDVLGLVAALGYREAAAVVGHDFGASVAAWCALVRPDVFRSLALMSAPFAGPPELPFATDGKPPRRPAEPDDPRGAGGPAAAAQALPMVLLDPAGQCADVALQAGRPRFPARLFPPQERRLEGQPPASSSPPGAPRSWRRCRPTTSWIWPTTCRRPSRRRCRPPPRSPPADGCPTTNSRSMPANTSATASRAG